MIIDISDILSCENKEETKQVQIELTSFISKLGEFPIISAAPIELVSQTGRTSGCLSRVMLICDVDSVQPLSGGSSDRYPLFD